MRSEIIKFVSTILLFCAWAGAIVAKHYWADIDIHSFELAITAALGGIGVTQLGK